VTGSITANTFTPYLGTAAAPSYTWAADPNTGLFGAGADVLGIATNGAERLRVGSTGNVGVGGTTLTSLFNVGSSAQFQVNSSGTVLAPNGSAVTPAYSFVSDPNTGIFGNSLDVLGFATAGVERLRVGATGNVGVGTTNPLALFSVGATSQFQVNTLGAIIASTGLTNSGMSTLGSGTLALTGSQNLLYGNIGSGVAGTSLLLLQTAGVERFRVEPTGKVTVQSLMLPTGAAANRVLTSDASGNATWQPPSVGSTYWGLAGAGPDIYYNAGNTIVGAVNTSGSAYVASGPAGTTPATLSVFDLATPTSARELGMEIYRKGTRLDSNGDYVSTGLSVTLDDPANTGYLGGISSNITGGLEGYGVSVNVQADSAYGIMAGASGTSVGVGGYFYGTTYGIYALGGMNYLQGKTGFNDAAPTGIVSIGGGSGAAGATAGLLQVGAGPATYMYSYPDVNYGSTVPLFAASAFHGLTLSASSSLGNTTTDAATVYIEGPPSVGSWMTITNPWALWVDNGNARFDGTLRIAGGAPGTGKILTSDAIGNATWQPPATGISGSGAAGQATFWTGASAVSGDNSFFWDNATKRLGIGTPTPASKLSVFGGVTVGSNWAGSTAAPTDGLIVQGFAGFGDNSPDTIVDIRSATTITPMLKITNTNGGNEDATIGFDLTDDSTDLFTIGVDDSDSDKFKISTTALGTNDRIVIDATGAVSVGTASPSAGYKFQVYDGGGGDAAMGLTGNGNSASVTTFMPSAAVVSLSSYATTAIDQLFQQTAAAAGSLSCGSLCSKMFIGTTGGVPLVFGVNSSNVFQRSSMEIAANGDTEVGYWYKFGIKSQAGGYLLWADPSQQKIGINHPGASQALNASLEVASSFGVEGVRIISNNAPALNVRNSVGTELFKVDVSGNLVRLNSVTYAWPAAQGAASTVLTNNGSGTLTWAAPAAGGVTGSGTTNRVAKFTAASTLGDSTVTDTGVAVGIGDTTPTSTLDVTGAIGVSDTAVIDASRRMFAANGALGAGTLAYSFSADTNTGLYGTGADVLRIATAGLDRVSVTATGAVGIGTASPTSTLDVAGSGNVSGMTTFGAPGLSLTGTQNLLYGNAGSAVAGTNLLLLQRGGVTKFKVDYDGNLQMPTGAALNRVLTSDASGNATWQALPAAGVTGSGTTNRLAKFTAASTLGDSMVTDNGTFVGIGNTGPLTLLDIGTGSSPASILTLRSGANAAIEILADTSGNASTEVPYLFMQDYIASDGAIVGFAPAADLDSKGFGFSGARAGALLIGTTLGNIHPVMIGQGGQLMMSITSSTVGIGAGHWASSYGALYVLANGGQDGIVANASNGYYPISAIGASGPAASFRRNTTDGVIIDLKQGATIEGTISVAGTTISYNAFTGSHYAHIASPAVMGRLVRMNGSNMYLGNDLKREIIYGVEETTQENDPAVLGSMLALQESQQPYSETNPYLVMAVGNGQMWVVDEGEDLDQGDYLISSSTKGHARKDPGTYAVAYSVARVAEPVDWSEVTEVGVGGKKHKLVSVLFESAPLYKLGVLDQDGRITAIDERVTKLEGRVDQLERELLELQMRQQQQ
jgi:hypothetical protein